MLLSARLVQKCYLINYSNILYLIMSFFSSQVCAHHSYHLINMDKFFSWSGGISCTYKLFILWENRGQAGAPGDVDDEVEGRVEGEEEVGHVGALHDGEGRVVPAARHRPDIIDVPRLTNTITSVMQCTSVYDKITSVAHLTSFYEQKLPQLLTLPRFTSTITGAHLQIFEQIIFGNASGFIRNVTL